MILNPICSTDNLHMSVLRKQLKLGFSWTDEQMFVQQMREVLRNVCISDDISLINT